MTQDDAIHDDQGMRMGGMAFDQQGRRMMGETTTVEREALRRPTWLIRNTTEVPVCGELTGMMKQIGDWLAARAVESTIPQIRFAPGAELVKLPVGLCNIIATESTNLKAEVDAGAITYAHWYQVRFIDRTMSDVACELKLPREAVCTSLGLGWNLDVLATELAVTDSQANKLPETIGEMSIGEVLALALMVGPAKFVAGPLALLIEIVVSCDLIMFYSYVVLAQGQLRSLIRWGHILYTKDQHDFSAQLERLRASVQHWLYSTLIFASGFFVGVDQVQPLHDPDRQ